MAAHSTSFYVYYRVAADAKAARAAIDAMMAEVLSRTGIAGRILARCDDASTWMEIYESVADAAAFARTLDECAVAHRAGAVAQDGVRTIERFSPLIADPSECGAHRG